ncbi:MAG TPA: class I SAM-dependent methyltransferase, partial [Chromatiaceae bacterium]|nr:class I SAM-dependent methyltransferase [Chromatiaceae bacterium]
QALLILARDPEALFLLLVHLHPPPWWIERSPPEAEVRGSNPLGRAIFPARETPGSVSIGFAVTNKQSDNFKPGWDTGRISTLWFDSHFNHAANRVIEWLVPVFSNGAGKDVLDFGCGGGITTLGVALRHPEIQVHGVDIGDKFTQLSDLAREQLGLARLPDNLYLRRISPLQPLSAEYELDAVFSWSVFEHVPRAQVPAIFRDLHGALKRKGFFFLQIEPLYYSPWGSHLRRFIDVPWAHLQWPTERLRRAVLDYEGEIPPQHRGHQYRALDMEAFKRFHLKEFESLNRITADEIVNMLQDAGFTILKEQRLNMKLPVPDDLLKIQGRETLLNNGLLLLGQKE